MKRHRRRKQKLPTEPITLDIERLSHDGRGIASNEGKIAFVEGALPGEQVSAVYSNRRSQYDELRAEHIHQPASDRVEPACAYAGICGGCSMQHVSGRAQRELKEQVLLEQLKHTGGLSDFAVLPPVTGPQGGYRRKARLAVRYVHKKGGTLVGFREKGSSFITDMNHCSVLVKEVADLIEPLRECIVQLENSQSIPQIEVAVGERSADSGQLQVALVFRHLEALSEGDQDRLLDFARHHGVDLYLQPKGMDSIHRVWSSIPDGDAGGRDEAGGVEERLYYFLPNFSLKMAFHPADFTQVNGEINRSMIPLALELLEPGPDDRVLDLFCGLGNFTLPLARCSGEVTGIEGSQEMVERGSENARRNGLDNVSFHAADLSQSLDDQAWSTGQYDRILLDPPRSGAIEIISRIAGLGAKKIVYISCNPATLARDSAELVRHGYGLTKAGILDMFPNTSHVESIALFEYHG